MITRSELFEWIQTVKPGDFPPAPFGFKNGTVTDTERWLSRLQEDVKHPPRDSYGAYTDELEKAYIIWNSENTRRELETPL